MRGAFLVARSLPTKQFPFRHDEVPVPVALSVAKPRHLPGMRAIPSCTLGRHSLAKCSSKSAAIALRRDPIKAIERPRGPPPRLRTRIANMKGRASLLAPGEHAPRSGFGRAGTRGRRGARTCARGATARRACHTAGVARLSSRAPDGRRVALVDARAPRSIALGKSLA